MSRDDNETELCVTTQQQRERNQYRDGRLTVGKSRKGRKGDIIPGFIVFRVPLLIVNSSDRHLRYCIDQCGAWFM